MYQTAARILLPLLLIACAAALPTSAQTTKMKTFRSNNVGIEFQYPDGWTVKRCIESSTEDCLMVEKTSGATSSTGTILVGTLDMNLEGALGENFMFEKVNGAWTMKGKYVSGKAKRIMVGRLQGVAAMSDCGVKDLECYTATLLTNGKRTVSFETSGAVSNAIVRNRMLKTLKFL
ncbi:MAG: hypothetical protein LC802_16305 [Acidobacteria bacterium]|nr:hypothetical protein [Acidobacteriota bacterium]